MKFPVLTASLAALALLLGGCGGKGTSASPPADFKVVAADGSAILTWTAEPDVDYWIFYGPGSNITTTNWATSGGAVVTKATPPRTIGGLTNGNTYSFTINGRKEGGPGGPGAPTQVIVPRLSGGTWTVGTPLGTAVLKGVAGGNGSLGYANVVVGAGGSIYSSINQAAFTTPTNPVAPADLNAACYGTLGWVVAGANGSLIFSIDTSSWAAQASGTTATLHGCASAGVGGFLVVGAAGTLLNSTNGTTWTSAASGTSQDLYGATFGNGRYVVVGANGTILTTVDGTTWTASSSGTTSNLRSVTYAALVNSALATTNVFVAVGDAGTVLTSADGITWTAKAPISPRDLTSIAYGGQFVAVGKGGVIYTSLDTGVWETRVSGTTNDLAAVTRTLSGYTAVGAQGTNVSSF